LVRDQLGFYAPCAREYGDVVPLRLGPDRGLLVHHPDAIEEILVTIAPRFRLTMETGQRVTPTPYVTLRPEPGLRMRLVRR
jgi:hypothetical protein